MAKVELKQPIVQAIAEDIQGAQSAVLVDYRGLTVAEDTELRKQLREAGVIYKVCKNTMMRRAFDRNFQRRCNSSGKNPLQICKRCKSIRIKSWCCRRNCL